MFPERIPTLRREAEATHMAGTEKQRARPSKANPSDPFLLAIKIVPPAGDSVFKA